MLATIGPYKVEVVQGNFISKEQVEMLKPGMTRQQVQELLGTALLSDVFHGDRWDYVFTLRRAGVAPLQRNLTLFFDGDRLDRFTGDEMPSEQEFAAAVDKRRSIGKVPRLQASEQELQKLRAARSEAPAIAPEPVAPLPASYPPLETRSGGQT